MSRTKISKSCSDKKVLVIVSHPDDEVLGCGGLLMEYHVRNYKTYVLYLNNGCHYRNNFDASEIKNQIHNVAKILGFHPIIENLKSGEFDSYGQRYINDIVKSYVDKIQPEIVVTHISNDLHHDHQITNIASMVASRFMHNSCVKKILEMPVISSSEINPKFDFTPNLFLDISQYIDLKQMAMEEYVYEVESFNELRGKSGIEGWARFYGMHIGVEYAEAYKIIRECL